MTEKKLQKGPAGHRFLITCLNILLAILVYWLLGFILDDISDLPGPSWTKIQAQYQDANLVKTRDALQKQANVYSDHITTLKKKQELLQTNIQSYQDTMNQLLALQKVSVEKGQAFSNEAQNNLTHATKLYLDNQQQFQALNNEITIANERFQQTQREMNSVNDKLQIQNDTATNEFNKQSDWHNLKLAFLKLFILVPLLIIAAYYFRKNRSSIYNSMTVAIGVAILIKILMVLHEHFPSRFFKYILILILIALVVRALLSLFKMMIAPKINWLQKQYKESYKKIQCGVCEYPIRPGALKFTPVIQETVKKDSLINSVFLNPLEKYSCPSCGTQLFEKCQHCDHTRHSLLTYCEFCGGKI